jgi:hypothetical protein
MKLINDRIKRYIAVSEVFGSMILLVITVVVFSIAYTSYFSTEVDEPAPNADIVAKITENSIVFKHNGGDDISKEADIILTNKYDISTEINLKDYLIEDKEDGLWNIGERVICQLDELNRILDFGFPDNVNLSVFIRDSESFSIIYRGEINEVM